MKPCFLLCLAILFCSPRGIAGQKVGFPKAKPLIDLTFPDGWEMKTEDGVLYAHPKRYESVVWNEGGKPTVKQDEETGMTVTVNDGIGTHADGTKHRLGLYQYAKIGSKKFYVVNTWALESGLRENAKAIDAMLESIRHK
jgi:hypothetical protein